MMLKTWLPGLFFQALYRRAYVFFSSRPERTIVANQRAVTESAITKPIVK